MKIFSKIIFFLIIFLILFSTVYQVSAADIWTKAKDFISIGESTDALVGDSSGLDKKIKEQAKTKFQQLIDFFWGLGLLAVFVSTVILGIKYMLVNPAEKSRVKQATVPYVIGTVIIFGALTIWKLIITILEGTIS